MEEEEKKVYILEEEEAVKRRSQRLYSSRVNLISRRATSQSLHSRLHGSDRSLALHASRSMLPAHSSCSLSGWCPEVSWVYVEDDRAAGLQLSYLFLDTWCHKVPRGKVLFLQGKLLYSRIGRRIRDKDLALICEFLADRHSVYSVDLAYNEITSLGIINTLYFFLKENTTVTELSLANNNISFEGAQELAALGSHLSLRVLRLNGNKIGPPGGFAMQRLLGWNRTLLHLDLGETGQNLSSVCALTVRLRSDYTRDTARHVSEASESARRSDDWARRESRATDGTAPSSISTGRFTLRSLAEEAQEPNGTLEVLVLDSVLGHFHYQLLSQHLARLVGNLLRVNESLVELHLEKNQLTDEDMEALSEGLGRNRSLRLLDLACNRVGDLGVERLAKSLPHTGLEGLMLNHNRVRDSGARSLALSLPTTKVRLLDLAHNSISDEGMMDILYTITKTPTILTFLVYGNPLTEKSLKKMREYLMEGRLLEEAVDVKVYAGGEEVGWRRDADPYKASYYDLVPPQSLLREQRAPPLHRLPPVRFVHHRVTYPRTMVPAIASPGAIRCDNLAGSCTK